METFHQYHGIGRGYNYDLHLKPFKKIWMLQVLIKYSSLIYLLFVHDLEENFQTPFYSNFHSSPFMLLHKANKDCLGVSFSGCSAVHLWDISSQASLPVLGCTLVLKMGIKTHMFSSFESHSLRTYIYNLVKKGSEYFPLTLALLNSLFPLSSCQCQEQTLIEASFVSNFVYWASITNRNLLVKLLTLVSESPHAM